MNYSDALVAAIEKANAQMRARNSEGWSISDDFVYRQELARLTGEPIIHKPWDADENCSPGHSYFNGVCVRCETALA